MYTPLPRSAKVIQPVNDVKINLCENLCPYVSMWFKILKLLYADS